MRTDSSSVIHHGEWVERQHVAMWMVLSGVVACSSNTSNQVPTMNATDGGGTSSTGSSPAGSSNSTGLDPETTTAGDDASSSDASSSGAVACDPTSRTDVVFAETGADPALTSLDVLVENDEPGQPIVIFVHGGGWVIGDKASHSANPAFAEFFADRGEILVSINYRLVGDPVGTTFAEQGADIASAIAWVVEHAEEFCGDPSRIHLMGHSAGAHLVAMAAADPSYLEAHGLHPMDISSVVSLDVIAYDIPWAIANAVEHDFPNAIMNLPAVFGDEAQQVQASPMTHIQAGAVPPSLVISAPDKDGVIQTLSLAASERYVDALTEANNVAVHVHDEDESHSSLAGDFGRPGDGVTEVVASFLDAH